MIVLTVLFKEYIYFLQVAVIYFTRRLPVDGIDERLAALIVEKFPNGVKIRAVADRNILSFSGSGSAP